MTEGLPDMYFVVRKTDRWQKKPVRKQWTGSR